MNQKKPQRQTLPEGPPHQRPRPALTIVRDVASTTDVSGAPAGVVIGRYVLFPPFAAGGMATVHIGRMIGPVGFSRTVAIKRLHPHFSRDSEFVSMFLDEARLAARIVHPNVVSVLDVVALDGELFLVMDFVRGESLARLLSAWRNQGKPAPVDVVLAVLTGVLHGLHAAHEARNEQGVLLHVVHRDVSPQNILVGTDGVARLVDFGVAKAADRAQSTREGQVKGKLDYMAPEQLECAEATRQTDIYAATVVLYEALAGRRLFEHADIGGRIRRILAGNFPPPSAFNPRVGKKLDNIVRRGLTRVPADRFATARDMALALEQLTAMAPACASRVGEWVRETAAEALRVRDDLITRIESVSDSYLRRVPSLTENSIRKLAPPARVLRRPPDLVFDACSADASQQSPPRGGFIPVKLSPTRVEDDAIDIPVDDLDQHDDTSIDTFPPPLMSMVVPRRQVFWKSRPALALFAATAFVMLLGVAMGVRFLERLRRNPPDSMHATAPALVVAPALSTPGSAVPVPPSSPSGAATNIPDRNAPAALAPATGTVTDLKTPPDQKTARPTTGMEQAPIADRASGRSNTRKEGFKRGAAQNQEPVSEFSRLTRR